MEQWTGSKLGKEYIGKGCILSFCLFNLYAEYIMWNAIMDEEQAGIEVAGEISCLIRKSVQFCLFVWNFNQSHRSLEWKEELCGSTLGEEDDARSFVAFKYSLACFENFSMSALIW